MSQIKELLRNYFGMTQMMMQMAGKIMKEVVEWSSARNN
jgi:hypothetical protein